MDLDSRAFGSRRLRPLIVAGDLAAVAGAFGLAYGLDAGVRALSLIGRTDAVPLAQVATMAAGFGILTVGFGFLTGAYSRGTSILQYMEIRAGLRAIAIAAAVTFALLFLFGAGDEVSRLLLSTGMVLAGIVLVVERRLLSVTLQGLGVWRRHAGCALIVGGGLTARLLLKKIVQAPASGLEVMGVVDDYHPIGSAMSCRLRQGEPEPFDVPVVGRTWQISRILERYPAASALLVCTEDIARDALDAIVEAGDAAGIEVGLVPALGRTRPEILRMEDITAIPVLRHQRPERKPAYDAVKRVIDLAVAVPLLVALSPMMLVAAAWIRFESPGNALFRQARIGRDGATFTMFKFRTMYREVEPFSPSPGSERDPRVTRAGRVLRLAGIDELPQLLNVIRGDMSMVGPRPEMPFIAESYSRLEETRLRVKPGITGLWQISPDRDVQIHENLEYDLYYVAHRSVLLDLIILFETLLFTISLIWRRLRLERRMRGRVSPRTVDASFGDGSYVLVALDQRAEAAAPEAWSALASTALAAGAGFVKILVAPENVAGLAGLGDGRADGATASEPRLEFVPYRSSAELRSWCDAAAIVVTDLEPVRDRAVSRDIDVVFLAQDEPCVLGGGNGRAPLAKRLALSISELVVPTEHTRPA